MSIFNNPELFGILKSFCHEFYFSLFWGHLCAYGNNSVNGTLVQTEQNVYHLNADNM